MDGFGKFDGFYGDNIGDFLDLPWSSSSSTTVGIITTTTTTTSTAPSTTTTTTTALATTTASLISPNPTKKCSCADGSWMCNNGCDWGESCQKSGLENTEYRCVPASLGECMAWGDPHVVTFDGAKNDVYGISLYTFAEAGFKNRFTFSHSLNSRL